MKYRDYFSLRTLHRFGVEPDRTLCTEGSAKEVRTSILAGFGDRLSEEDRAFLAHKTDCALTDLRLTAPVRERESVEIPEAAEERLPGADFAPVNEVPEAGRVL